MHRPTILLIGLPLTASLLEGAILLSVTTYTKVDDRAAYSRLVSSMQWQSQLPAWVSSISSASVLTSVIQNHVTTLVARYKGKIFNWDVCAEVLNEDGSMRASVFYNVLGKSFINIAFAAARAADPSPKLYIVGGATFPFIC